MLGPRMGGAGMRGPIHGSHMYGRPMHRPHPMPRTQRHYSYLGTGLSALVGAAVGTKIVNNISNKQSINNNNSNYYEVFSYCPNCGTKREGNNTNCSNCGASLIKD